MSFAFFKSQIVTMSTPASIDQLRESFNLRCEQFSMWTTNKLWLKSRTWITIMTSKRNETKRRFLWLPRSDLGPKKDGLFGLERIRSRDVQYYSNCSFWRKNYNLFKDSSRSSYVAIFWNVYFFRAKQLSILQPFLIRSFIVVYFCFDERSNKLNKF